ncbi:DNA-directed RNA polymerase III subunit C82 [Saccharomycopsis crataegensis]|uniref:DNA-directed RNA polymerase III subunit RPC3 n=1 Tax=Saccharomycopsis crataegensis TaxID=43959 RepID=A0AAV5QRS1_9ASCO|nr:DNA-directed RNA polymerase III subunit C82 [Saccharomycopsis crataegensis]
MSSVDNGSIESVSEKASRIQSAKSYLFTTLLKDLLGLGPSIIISKLYSNGRLTLRELSAKTKIGKRKVQGILVKLIQLKCVKYFAPSGSKKPTVNYYVNEEGLLIFLYSGEIIASIKKKYSDDLMAEIIQNFLNYGNLTLSDYLSNLESHKNENQNKENQNKEKDENGSENRDEDDNDEDLDEKSDIEKKFNILIQDGWIVPIKSDIEFQNKYDIYRELYQKNYAKYPKATSISEIKRKKEVKYSTEIDFNKLFEFSKKDIYESDNSFFNKGANTMFGSDSFGSSKIKQDLAFKFSLARFFKHMRSVCLVKIVNQRLGPVSSKVFGLVMQKIEKNSQDCSKFALDFADVYLNLNSKMESQGDSTIIASSDIPAKSLPQYLSYAKLVLDAENSVCFTLQDIAALLKKREDIDLSNSIKFKSVHSNKRKNRDNQNMGPATKKIKQENEILAMQVLNGNHNDSDEEGDENTEDMDEKHSVGALYQHLELMANSSIPFLRRNPNGAYYVPFSELMSKTKEMNFMYLVKSVLGRNEFKVLNCIIKSKLIDEKALINHTLLKDDDLRVCINRLFKLQAIEVQEIPKTVDRQANRSAFAYRFNKKFNTRLLENNLLHEISLIFNHINETKEKNKLLLGKANREDIKGKEEDMLLTSELNQLKWLNENELNCVSRIHRARSIWEVFAIF